MNGRQLSTLLPSNSPAADLDEVKRLFPLHYPAAVFERVERLYRETEDLFAGRFPGYRPCRTEYHNFSHTADTFLAVMRIIDGYNLSEAPFSQTVAFRLLAAALFHDSGYLQRDWDTLGTGAKYTREHVVRSREFVSANAGALRFSPEEVAAIAFYIDSTAAVTAPSGPAAPPPDRMAAALVGAADLIAQMSDRLYLEKLLFLYYEFREAGIPGYDTEFDIIRQTLGFYELTRERLEKDYAGVHRYAARHFRERFEIDADLYREAIERNIEYVQKIIADPKTNFRAKLKRATG